MIIFIIFAISGYLFFKYMWPVSGTTNDLTCWTITWLDLVLVENQAWYDGGEMYNGVYGWTIMVT